MPMTFEMTGVIRANWQLIPTATVSPRLFVAPFPVRSVKTGVGTTVVPLTTGRAQLIAVASLMSWFRYAAWTAASPVPVHASGLSAATFAAIRAMFCRLMYPR